MWKLTPLIFIVFLLTSCSDHQTKSNPASPSTSVTGDSLPKAVTKDSATIIVDLTKQILTVIKAGDYATLSSFFHPVAGTRFSPYGFIDTTKDIVLTATEFLQQFKKQTRLNWGNYDGSGAPILLTVEDYFKKFVYDEDFLHAEKTSFNKTAPAGNSLNNLESVYKDANFTESYFSGSGKRPDGMNWSCLRLVYKKYHGKIYLAGIVHDQWTI